MTSKIEFLTRDDAPNLAYIKTLAKGRGSDLPMVVFLGGFASDMSGTKATYLEAQCKKRGQGYIRLDYQGHGASDGLFEEGCVGAWARDVLDILDRCTSGKIILVGSSLGGWLSLLVALKRPQRVQAIIGLAAAPDFTKLMEAGMSTVQAKDLKEQGYFELPNDYDDAPYVITQKLLDDGRENSLLDGKIDISIPVRLIQGKQDKDVQWQTANHIKEAIIGEDVEVLFLEEADHRLSAPDQLSVIDGVICSVSESDKLGTVIKSKVSAQKPM